MSDECGCGGAVGATAAAMDNPPGQPALSYRVGTHASFLRAMLARMSAVRADAGRAARPGEAPLTFQPGGAPEAATALLDGWACVADVLTFYQERIANEGYLRTATERRSVVELGRLVGYEPRPGVAASVHLAFAVQEGYDGEIPAETKVQSMPRPGQTAQTFETSDALPARAEWNALRPRQRATGRFVRYELAMTKEGRRPTGRVEMFLRGVGQNVREGDVVVLRAAADLPAPARAPSDLYRVASVTPDAASAQTTVRLIPFSGVFAPGGEWDRRPAAFDPGSLVTRPVAAVRAPAALPPSTRSLVKTGALVALTRALTAAPGQVATQVVGQVAAGVVELSLGLSGGAGLLARRDAGADVSLTRWLRGAVTPATCEAYVLRRSAQVFGHNAPLKVTVNQNPSTGGGTTTTTTTEEHDWAGDETTNQVFLDGEFANLRKGDLVVVDAPPTAKDGEGVHVFQATSAAVGSRAEYALTGRATRVTFAAGDDWRDDPRESGVSEKETVRRMKITPARRAMVYVGAEALALATRPVVEDVAGAFIDLDGVFDELPTGRLLFVEGERTDVSGVDGVRGVELVTVGSVSTMTREPPTDGQGGDADEPSDEAVDEAGEPSDEAGASRAPLGAAASPYTRVALVTALRHSYKRASVVVRGNVAHATHGETRQEVLGSGDAVVPDQRFTLRQGPRTWVAAPAPSGVASTLAVRVDGVLWPEVRTATTRGPRDEVVLTRSTGEGDEQVQGGDGVRGRRFPTGVENVTARYRVGLGLGGNVEAGRISTLLTRPMGVREVVNPARSSGGADADAPDAIRARIPVVTRAVDRLVSVRDHADFALNFAGVMKAAARRAIDAHGRPAVTVVIAGDEDVPIDPDSDLYGNLVEAFKRYGDPSTYIRLAVARPSPLSLQARVRIDPRYRWERVEAALREALCAGLGWGARAIGEPARLSRVLAVMQSVAGVVMVDVDAFAAVRQELTADVERSLREASGAAGARPDRSLALLVAVANDALDPAGTRPVDALLRRLVPVPERPATVAAESGEVVYFSRSSPRLVILSEVKP